MRTRSTVATQPQTRGAPMFAAPVTPLRRA
jgi:hypothetical protein